MQTCVDAWEVRAQEAFCSSKEKRGHTMVAAVGTGVVAHSETRVTGRGLALRTRQESRL